MKTLVKLTALSCLALSVSNASAGTLEDVQKQGYLNCGVSTGLAGFSQKDEKGEWSGLDVDVCRAVAAATLGDAKKVKFVPLTAKVSPLPPPRMLRLLGEIANTRTPGTAES